MKFDTEGTYTLTYTATDSCGNSTSENRTVVVASPRTVLYTDGTFIINELPEDRAANVALHGAATNTYIPFDPNGATDVAKYIFDNSIDMPWNGEKAGINRVLIGEPISPPDVSYWFSYLTRCESIDLTNLSLSECVRMKGMFEATKKNANEYTDVDLSIIASETQNVTAMQKMFYNSMIRGANTAPFITTNVTDMNNMFYGTRFEAYDLTSYDTSKVTNMGSMFASCSLIKTVDISSFDTSNVTRMTKMFELDQSLETVYASSGFVTTNVSESKDMFKWCNKLVGGEGTTFNSSYTDKTYAHIDGGTSNPGYFTLKE